MTVTDESTPGATDGVLDATGSVSGGSGSYQYELFADAGLTTSLGTSISITGLTPATYYLQVTDLTNGCITPVESFIINAGVCDSPILTSSSLDNTFCVGADGSVTSTATTSGGEPSSYTFTWYSGASALPGNEVAGPTVIDGATGLTATGLFGGNYTEIGRAAGMGRGKITTVRGSWNEAEEWLKRVGGRCEGGRKLERTERLRQS